MGCPLSQSPERCWSPFCTSVGSHVEIHMTFAQATTVRHPQEWCVSDGFLIGWSSVSKTAADRPYAPSFQGFLMYRWFSWTPAAKPLFSADQSPDGSSGKYCSFPFCFFPAGSTVLPAAQCSDDSSCFITALPNKFTQTGCNRGLHRRPSSPAVLCGCPVR